MNININFQENSKAITVDDVKKEDFEFVLEIMTDHLHIDIDPEPEKKERDFEGWEIKEAVREAIFFFADQYLPNEESERFDPEYVDSAGDSGVKIIYKMAETMINETEVYEPYNAMVEAVQIACRYMWERSKRL